MRKVSKSKKLIEDWLFSVILIRTLGILELLQRFKR